MSDPARPMLGADDFIAWAMDRPPGERWELAHGEVIAMAPERTARAKLRIAERLAAAVSAGLPCDVFLDGMAVQVGEATVHEPDALLRYGAPLPDDAVKITDPVVVVEVVAPSSRARDTGAKLADYMRIPSLRDYLVVRTEDKTIIHRARGADGAIMTRIIRDGTVALAAGLTLTRVFDAR